MRPAQIVALLNAEDVFPFLDQGRLKTRSASADISPRAVALLREHRDALIAFLADDRPAAAVETIATRAQPHLPSPLSFAQRRLWFLHQLDPAASAAYHIGAALALRGPLDLDALRRTLARIVERHEVLRTRFVDAEPEALQQVLPAQTELSLPIFDLRGDDAQARVWEHLRAESETPFDLSGDGPLRLRLLRTGEDEHVLAVTMHHIVSDGWSNAVLVRELGAIYAATVAGRPDPLPLPPIQYADYAAWQRAGLDDTQLQAETDYWKRHLADAPALLELPADRARPPRQSYVGERVPVRIDAATSAALRGLATRHRVTHFMLLLAAWAALLQRLSGQDSVVIGCPVANRQRSQVEPLIGFFANTMPLHVRLDDAPSVSELLRRVKELTLEGYAYQNVPFEYIVDALRPQRSLSHSPLFQVSLTVSGASERLPDLHGLQVQALTPPRHSAQFDLALALSEDADGFCGELVYARDLFERATVERWLGHFAELLRAMAADDAAPVDTLALLTSQQRQAMSELAAGEAIAAHAPETALAGFERHRRERPDALAVVAGAVRWSHTELDRAAAAVAASLRAAGVVAGDRVALLLERDAWLPAAVLGVWKAGAAYLPLDPASPPARIGAILADAAPRAIVAARADALAGIDAAAAIAVIALDALDTSAPAAAPADAVPAQGDNAYLIYTSGSTGRPKGVSVGHAALAHYLDRARSLYAADSLGAGVVATTLAFDATVTSLILPLSAGRAVHVLPADPQDALDALVGLLGAAEPLLFKLTPAHLDALAQLMPMPGTAAHCVVVGGEALAANTLARFRERVAPNATVVNEYGPTEATVGCMTHVIAPGERLTDEDSVPIGRPFPGMRIDLLDAHGQPVPVGVRGQLHIAGPQLADGYFGRDDQGGFHRDAHGRRAYRSGDFGRWGEDGRLRFLGRGDAQLKIRGYRVEPGEIEARLCALAGVLDAAVLAQGDGAQRRLIAYAVPADGAPACDEADLRAALAAELPHYMLPDAVVWIARMPLTANGKRDLAALPAWSAPDDADAASEPPRTASEHTLHDSWCAILQRERIGIDEDFFALGGHSLLATRAVADIGRRLGKTIALRAVFEHPTVRALAAYVDAHGETRIELLPRAAGVAPAMSHAQKRLWILDQVEGGSRQYHIASSLRLHGELDPAACQVALDGIIARHEVLRTRFLAGDGACEVAAQASATLRVDDLRAVAAAERETTLTQRVREEVGRPFDLAADTLLRAAIFRLDEREWVAVLTVHHIASDGGSSALLVSEFAQRYAAAASGRAPALAALPVQYGDYALWQQQVLDEAALQRGLDYWRERLEGAPPVHGLPLDRPWPAQRDFSGGRVRRRLDSRLSARLRELARSRAATPFMLLHAAFAAVLARWSGEDDIVVGSPVSGRAHPATESLIGCFVNSIAIRTRVDRAAHFDALIEQSRVTVLDALAHQAIPFDLVVEAVNPPRSLGHASVFQISFTMHQDRVAGLELPGLSVGGVEAGTDVSRFDLELHARDLGDGFDMTLMYAAELFDAGTIERLGDALTTWLAAAVAQPQAPLHTLPAMSADESARVLALGAPSPLPRAPVCAHALFEQQARAQPDAPAVVCDGEVWSYSELDRRANRIAHFLHAQGIGPGARVGLCMERSHDLFAGLLGTLKAGAAYVPVDPAYPHERIAAMLEDAAPELLLSQESVLEALPALSDYSTIPVDGALAEALFGQCAEEALSDAGIGAGATDPAYVVFTSGSTGRPKGVVVPHRGLVNLALAQRELYAVGAGDRVLAFASASFDGAAWEWLMALANGAALHVCDEDDRRSPARLSRLLERAGITHAAIPPALLAQLDIATTPAPRVLFVAGEACDERLAWAWAQRGRVVNSYGPSEATVAATSAEVIPGRPLSLGRALPNVELRVLDAHGAAVPVGVPGELYIGGPGLADGYLADPALTARCFLDGRAADGGRLYRSGDRVRWNAHGELEFLGRVDAQVKIRGHRVEPGEIAAVLRGHEGVSEAVVTVRGEGALRRLVAYLVAAENTEGEEVNETLLIKSLRERVRRHLPDYMMPAAFVVLDALPLTGNGKVDPRRLPEPDYQAQALHVAPRDEREAALVAIWRDVLRLEQVGVHDNFFEIGGDSILAIQVVSRANRAGVAITTRHLFVAQTVAELAALAATLEAPAASAPQDEIEGGQVLLPVHRLLIGLDEVDRHHYNQAVLLSTPADFDPRTLEDVVRAVYRRHDALRLRFAERADGWQAWYAPLDEAMLAATIVREALPREDAGAFVSARCDHWQRGFDLEHGPLLRVVHFAPADAGEPGRLLLLAQHMVVDGVSWRILLADIERAYAQAAAGAAIVLDPKTSSFQQWGQALLEHAGSPRLAAQKAFWLAQCQREVAPWRSDFGGAEVGRMSDNALVSAVLDAAATRALQHDCGGAYRTQINELLLAGVYLGLRAWSGHDAFRVRMEGHGREDLFDGLDVTQTMGYFTGIYPLVIGADSDEVGAVIKAIKEQYRAVPDHGIGFGIAHHLGADPDIAQAAAKLGPPDLEFNYLGQFDQMLNAQTALQAAPESVGDKVSARRKRVRRVGLTGRIFAGELSLVLDYSRAQYRAETLQALVEAILDGLRRVIAHCSAPGAGARTPSDFPLARIDQPRLDAWQAEYGAIARLYPATPMQAGLHYHSQIDRAAYVVQSYPTLHGPFDKDAFRAAWNDTVARHDILRTAFAETGGSLHQIVLENAQVPWRELDWRGLEPAEQEARFAQLLVHDRNAGFDFTAAPLLRLTLVRLGEDSHRVLWTQHHITLDGWSGPLVYRDVLERYVARIEGRPDTLAAPAAYGDYIGWLARQDPDAARAYWRESLAGIALPTPLGVDRLPGDGEHGHREHRLRLTAAASRALEALAQRLKVTVNTLLQWSWGYLLHRYSGQDEVVFGTTLSGRPAEVPGIEAMVGLFIQTVPVAVRFGRDADTAAMLARLHGEFAESTQYGFLPLPQIQREAGGQPLFDSLLVFENLPSDARDQAAALPGRLRIERDSAPQFTHYRLTVIAVNEAELLLRLGYRAEHFAQATIDRLAGHLRRVLEDLPAAVAARREPVLHDADELAAIEAWNDTRAHYPRESSLADLFEAQAARTPDAVAAQAGAIELSYAALDARANRIAHGLRARGVEADARVAIVAPRGLEMLVAMLAVLKAGGAYVPVDPAQPAERVRYLLEDAAPVAVLAAADLADGAHWLSLDPSAWAQWPDSAPRRGPASGRELAYVMYTSGSTGKPKGVMVEHRGVARLVIGSDYALLSSDDRVAHCSNPAFDASTWEVWAAWLHGARVVVIDQDTVLDAPALREELLRTGVTAMWMTVGLFNRYADTLGPAFARLRHLLVGGDALDPRRIARLAQSPFAPARLVNGYGPTESTTFALTHAITAQVDGERAIPIGKPIANTTVHLLDARLQPVPLGVVGEICIGGDGLARGYLNQPELTAERFIDTAAFGRVYRSGDLGRWLPDGTVEFVGRRDAQIKLRGFRIELGEIEAAIAALPGVREAVAVARDDARGDRQIVAYAVADDGFDPVQARRRLAAALPDYLLPAAIVALPRLPLTGNGKVDRAALPAPDWSAHDDDTSPQTATEQRVHRIWCEVLERDSVGTQRSFFEVGGHSLLATRVVAAVRAEFGCELRIADLFARSSIVELAAWIDALAMAGTQPAAGSAEQDDAMEMSEW